MCLTLQFIEVQSELTTSFSISIGYTYAVRSRNTQPAYTFQFFKTALITSLRTAVLREEQAVKHGELILESKKNVWVSLT